MERKADTEDRDEGIRAALMQMKGPEIPEGFTNSVLEEARGRREVKSTLAWKIAVPSLATAVLLFVFLGPPFVTNENGSELSSSVGPEKKIAVGQPSPQKSPMEVPPEFSGKAVEFGKDTAISGPNPIPADDETEIRRDAVKPAPQVRLGGGKSPSSDPSMGGGEIKPEIILSILGIDGVFDEGGWKVKSVTTNSIAAKAGVKAGDVIESVNDLKLSRESVFLRSLSADRLLVRRGGTRITLRLDGK